MDRLDQRTNAGGKRKARIEMMWEHDAERQWVVISKATGHILTVKDTEDECHEWVYESDYDPGQVFIEKDEP